MNSRTTHRYLKAILLLLGILLCSIPIRAQTNVSGFISANTTWTLAGSPYIIIGNALLSSGYTLTIDPGVVVKFNTSTALQIDGQLIAIGTNSQRIIFTSNQASPMPGDWAKLHFSDLCTDAVFNANGNYLSGTIMKYCDVLYGGGLGFGSIDVQQSSPYFSHCTIMNSSASGINCNCPAGIIDSTTIQNCADYGVYFYTTGHFSILDDSIVNNSNGGIHVLQMYDSIQSRITDSYFEANNNAISWQNNYLQCTTITGNEFVNNTGTTIDLLGNYDTITCNRFLNNSGGPAIHWGDHSNPISAGLIFNNLFEGNSASDGSVVLIGAGYYSGYNDTLIFANNIVRNNSCSSTGSCCHFEPFLSNAFCGQYLRIYDNMFSGNSGGNVVKLHGDQNSNAGLDFLYMKHNVFTDPACQYELYNDVPYGSPNLYLDNNYWGSLNAAHVDSVIYDYFDYANQSVVYYSPFLTSPFVIDSTCRAFVDMPEGVANDHIQHENEFQIYPVPFSDEAILRTNGILQNATFIMTNCLGQEVKEIDAVSGQTVTISRDDLPDGIYFFRLMEGSAVIAAGKLVITTN